MVMPPKGKRRQAFGEEIGGDSVSESTQDTPIYLPSSVEEMDYTLTRSAGALRRIPPTTAIRGGEEALEYRRPGIGPVPFKGFGTAAEAE
jgi:hypothetical protein